MKWSKGLVSTLREAPREAEVLSHKLMFRAGLVRRLAAGLYTYLPLGLRVIRKIERIIREEMGKQGAQEILMPILQPRELWEASGRWDDKELGMLKLRNREKKEFALGPTHEEVITNLVSKEVKSYRELPLNLYQIQTKFRDELRPRFGVIRAREFIMKDAYSFDIDEKAAEVSYQKMYIAYGNIFRRLGLKTCVVEADPGAMGGGKSEEFIALADIGEDIILSCSQCDYAVKEESVPKKGIDNKCPKCLGKLAISRGIEVGQIFNLGDKYSQALKATCLNEEGKERIILFSYSAHWQGSFRQLGWLLSF